MPEASTRRGPTRVTSICDTAAETMMVLETSR